MEKPKMHISQLDIKPGFSLDKSTKEFFQSLGFYFTTRANKFATKKSTKVNWKKEGF